MYYFYGKVNWGHVVCLLYGGGLYLEESVMGGSTVYIACFGLYLKFFHFSVDDDDNNNNDNNRWID